MNKHLILVRYIPATSHRASKIELKSGRKFRGEQCKILIPYDHESLHISEIASSWLKAHGYTVHCVCEVADGVGILVNEFTLLSVAKAQ